MLTLENVSAGYGTFQALFGVSLEVKEGEAVAVIGPNGAGKTTLLRVISKLIDATGGELAMDGRSPRNRSCCWPTNRSAGSTSPRWSRPRRCWR